MKRAARFPLFLDQESKSFERLESSFIELHKSCRLGVNRERTEILLRDVKVSFDSLYDVGGGLFLWARQRLPTETFSPSFW